MPEAIPTYQSARGNVVHAAQITAVAADMNDGVVLQLGEHGTREFDKTWRDVWKPAIGLWLVINDTTGARATLSAEKFAERFTALD